MYALTRRTNHMPVYNPFREMEALERAFFGSSLSSPRELRSFRTDITDKGDHYLLQADLPGFAREDIQLELQDELLTIRAQRSTNREEKDKEERIIRRERAYGSYSRSFNVSGIDTEGIRARYENGVLSLTLPKQEEQKPAVRRLEIE